jgi:hypothetical protein
MSTTSKFGAGSLGCRNKHRVVFTFQADIKKPILHGLHLVSML